MDRFGNPTSIVVIMGRDYASLALSPESTGYFLKMAECLNADLGHSEKIIQSHFLETGHIFLRMIYSKDGKCQFFYSTDDKNYKLIGKVFHVREGKWIGAKVGLFAVSAKETGIKGYADFDWFRIE